MADSTSADRIDAIRLITTVVKDGKSLGELLRKKQQALQARDAARLQEVTYGTMRWSYRLDAILMQLLKKPLRNKDTDIRVLLWVALYEVIYMRTPDYAVVSSYASITSKLRKAWAKGLVNASLREFLRSAESVQQEVDENPASRYSLPDWIYESVQADWPKHCTEIFNAANSKAPLVLRANALQVSQDDYVARLAADGLSVTKPDLGKVSIEMTDGGRVESLPGYADGYFAVQDSAAQLAAELLDPRAGERVLDACAAPGGKTGHLIELQPDIKLTAIDDDASRLARVEENLGRLKHQATLLCADAADLKMWWDNESFDAILLDAPCSALGVLRRHPDIRRLRRAADIAELSVVQRSLLDALWQTLRSGGRLVYVTCSVLRQENEHIVSGFLRDTTDATEVTINADWGHACQVGRQILPGQHGSDGFYYAILAKQ